jgi:hypothetical protein
VSNKKKTAIKNYSVIISMLILCTSFIPITKAASPVICYAMIIDQFGGSSSNPNNSSGKFLVEELVNLGWDANFITTFYGDDEISKSNLDNEMNYIQVNIDANDLLFVFFHVEDHSYLNDTLDFDEWFPDKLLGTKTAQKIVLIESSESGASIEQINYIDGYGLSSVAADEKNIRFTNTDLVNWSLSESPFLGGISAHFWIKTINNITADISGNNVVTMDEVNSYSLVKIRELYNEAFNNNLTWAQNEYGIVNPNDTVYPNPLSYNFHTYNQTLNATDFIINNENYTNPSSFWLPTLIAGVIIIPFVIFELYSFRKRLRIRKETLEVQKDSEEV